MEFSIRKPSAFQAPMSLFWLRRREFALLALPIATFLISFPLGRYPVSIDQLISVIGAKFLPIEHTWPDTVDTVVYLVRMPRILAAMMVGLCLAVAGASYQGMFRNPLVSPDILGAAAGAGFGAALAINLGLGAIWIQVSAFVFALSAVGIAYILSTKVRWDPILVLVLAGILVGTVFTAVTSFIKFVADPLNKLPAITFWLLGGLSTVTLEDLKIAAIPAAIGLAPILLLRWRINVLSLGDEEAKSLGLDTRKLRLIVIVCSTLMTAAAVSIAGLVGWVGLVIPHLARIIVGPNFKVLLPASLSIGCAYLLLVDDVARVITSNEIPLGILTSSIGAPFFFILLWRGRSGWMG